MVIQYAYCQSYSDLRGYSDKGGGGEGGRVVIRVLYAYSQSFSDIRGYSDKGKGRWYSVYCTRTVRVQRYSDKGG